MMDASTRRTRFEERVRIEREFLVPLNSLFGSFAPLAGMTNAAITSWEVRASAAPNNVNVVRLAAPLREAAARAELLTDNSRDVFAPAGRTGPDSLAALRAMLDNELRAGDPS
jgi:hypothetical protein